MPNRQLIKRPTSYLGRDQWAKPKWLEGKEISVVKNREIRAEQGERSCGVQLEKEKDD